MNPQGALAFLLKFAFDIYIIIVFTRFLMQLVRADFYNPVSQFVVRATNPILVPMRRVIKGYGGLDVASLLLLFVLITAKILVIVGVVTGKLFIAPMLAVGVLHEAAYLLLQYFFWLIIAGVIMSWVVRDPGHPIYRVVMQLSEPLMAPARKIIPPMGGLDLSPMLVMVLIIAIEVLFGLHHSFLAGLRFAG